MRRTLGTGGSASMAALALLIILASAAAGGIMILQAALVSEKRCVEREDLRLQLEKEAQRAIKALCKDKSPRADSPLDSVWEEIRTPGMEGMSVTLKDVSSALNPNWAQKNVFIKTGLKNLLRSEKSAEEMQQRRVDKGFSLDIDAAFGDLINEGAVGKHFTAYGYANLNVTDEFALRRLYAERTGDEAGANVFHARVQQLLMEKKILKPKDVKEFLGSAYDGLYPVMNAEPVYNVHFASELLITELLSYPGLKVPQPKEAARIILDSRGGAELTREDLNKIIGAPEESRIYQYLGVTTWFWSIAVSAQGGSLEVVAARLPFEEDEASRFVITEERYSP